MKQSSQWKMWTLAFIATALFCGGCGKKAGEAIDDTTITTRVKTAMLNDPNVGSLKIDVDTVNGVVTLSGVVRSQVERDKAIELARKASGVTNVKDALQVMP